MGWIFRGKRVDTGEWVKGYFLKIGGISYILPLGLDLKDIVEVDPETVCRSTGLPDKNKMEIFEGDVISKRVNIYSLGGMKSTGERLLVGAVIWDESSTIYPGGWSIKAKDEHGNDAVYVFDTGFEITGNIFDNPELINWEMIGK